MTPTATAQPVTYDDAASLARFSVARCQRMIETGILTSEDKVELLENYVVLKMPRNPPHDGTILRISKRLGRRLPPGWDLRSQSAIVLPDSQPEPDFSVVREEADDYTSRYPDAGDTGLIVEVADTSLLRDQWDKARIYARAGIATYWIVNLQDRRIEVHTQPSGPTPAPGYAAVQGYQLGDAVPLTLGEMAVGPIPVADLLP